MFYFRGTPCCIVGEFHLVGRDYGRKKIEEKS